ncbi:hypothetical protein Hanom_Chr14g01317351 [Helianthus anomalus]
MHGFRRNHPCLHTGLTPSTYNLLYIINKTFGGTGVKFSSIILVGFPLFCLDPFLFFICMTRPLTTYTFLFATFSVYSVLSIKRP